MFISRINNGSNTTFIKSFKVKYSLSFGLHPCEITCHSQQVKRSSSELFTTPPKQRQPVKDKFKLL